MLHTEWASPHKYLFIFRNNNELEEKKSLKSILFSFVYSMRHTRRKFIHDDLEGVYATRTEDNVHFVVVVVVLFYQKSKYLKII